MRNARIGCRCCCCCLPGQLVAPLLSLRSVRGLNSHEQLSKVIITILIQVFELSFAHALCVPTVRILFANQAYTSALNLSRGLVLFSRRMAKRLGLNAGANLALVSMAS